MPLRAIPSAPRAASSSPFPSVAFECARADATASLARGVLRIAVIGPAGVGKSALLAQLARDVAPAGEIAWLQPPAMIAPDAATLLVDEIDRLDETTRASLLARPRGTRMIVAGIEDPDPTDDTVRVVLTPLEPHEIGPYVRHRLHNAGLPADLFEEDAIARLGNASSRVPRVLDALAGRALFAAKLDEADKVTALHARQAIEEHAALLAAKPLVAERIWPESAPKPHARRSAMPIYGAVAVGCFLLGAVLVLRARASDAPPVQMTATANAAPLTEADAARPVAASAAPMTLQDGPQRIVVQYGRNDASGAQAAQAIAERLRTRGFQVAELRPVDLRINQAASAITSTATVRAARRSNAKSTRSCAKPDWHRAANCCRCAMSIPSRGRARWKSGCRHAEARARASAPGNRQARARDVRSRAPGSGVCVLRSCVAPLVEQPDKRSKVHTAALRRTSTLVVTHQSRGCPGQARA